MFGIPPHPVPPPQGGRGRCGALRFIYRGSAPAGDRLTPKGLLRAEVQFLAVVKARRRGEPAGGICGARSLEEEPQKRFCCSALLPPCAAGKGNLLTERLSSRHCHVPELFWVAACIEGREVAEDDASVRDTVENG